MDLPKISIILVTYLGSNQKYVDLCLRSIDNLAYPKDKMEVVLISSGEHKAKVIYPEFNKWVWRYHSDERLHFPEAVNFGVEHASESSTHYLLLNDDTIMTKYSLHNLAWRAGQAEIILQPISNCDNYVKYNLAIGYDKDKQFQFVDKRFYRYDEWAPNADEMMSAQSLYTPGLITQEWVAFYATLIPKSVWQKVGPLDPNFKTGQDDCDYCLRARKLGIPAAVELSSLVWHFGGVTADQALTPELRKYNIDYYRQKHGVMPP